MRGVVSGNRVFAGCLRPVFIISIWSMDSTRQEKKEAPKGFVPEPFSYHEEIELKIDTLTNLGLGLGRKGGWVVMVPFCLPGERVRARIYRNRSNYSEADLVEVLETSSTRVDPGCPLFTRCGGCQYQHMRYAEQLEWKRAQVRELFQKIAGIADPPVHPAHASPRQYGYRSKLTPHWNKPGSDGNIGEIGFLRHGNRHRLIDVEQCPLATEAINEALPGVRDALRRDMRHSRKKKKGGTLLLRDAEEGVVTQPDKLISERAGAFHFQFRAGDFFQNNHFILPDLVNIVAEQAAAPGIRYLVDTYCGTGLFAISLSGRFEKVMGIEITSSAIQWAINNAAINRVENCEFRTGSAEAIFDEIPFLPGETAVIVDPPRKGCDSSFLQQLVTCGPKRVVYVSCDPSTQARDVKTCLAGGYSLLGIFPVDLFPQTRHIESIAILDKETC